MIVEVGIPFKNQPKKFTDYCFYTSVNKDKYKHIIDLSHNNVKCGFKMLHEI